VRIIRQRLCACVAVSLTALVLVACESKDEEAGQACFPIPATGATRSPAAASALQKPAFTRPAFCGESCQGTTLQGVPLVPSEGALAKTHPILPSLKAKGWPFGFADLNGASLKVATTMAPVALVGGALVADGFASTEALRGKMLEATTRDGARFSVEITRVESEQGLVRVEIEIDGQAACAAGDHGVFVGGAWNERGAHTSEPGTVTYSCGSGVIAKCAGWGYTPWTVGDANHQACTRLARADYCGDGNSWTMERTPIGLVDALGIRVSPVDDRYSFEASWGPDGAVCVNQTRYAVTDGKGNEVRPSCLAALPSCTGLGDARGIAAKLTNYSMPAAVAACE
jgi:ADYC domain